MDAETLRNELLTSQWYGFSPGNISYTGGNVGIGTVNPVVPLHIYKSGGGGIVQGEIRICSDDGQKSRVGMYEESVGSTWGCWMQYNGAGDTFEFGTKRNTVDSAPQMTIASTGYINYSTTYKYNIYYSPTNWSYTTTTVGSGSVLWSFSYTLPQASYVIVSISGHWQGPSAGSLAYMGVAVDGSHINNSGQYDSYTVGGSGGNGTGGYFHDYWYAGWQGYSHTAQVKLAAGAHTFGLWVFPYTAGTNSWNGGGISLTVIPVNYL